MSKKVIYFNDDEILKGGDMDSVISKTNHNTLLTSNSNIHVGGEGVDGGGEGIVGSEQEKEKEKGVVGSEGEDVVVSEKVDEGGVVVGEGGVVSEEEGGVVSEEEGGGGNGRGDGNEKVIEEEEEEEEEEEGEEGGGGEDNCGTPLILRGGANESTQLNQLVEQLLATNMAKISNQLTSQTGGGQNITDVLSGINEQLSNLNTNIGKIIQLNNKNI
jgi:hypothetical protein